MCWWHADVWSHHGHYPIHPLTPPCLPKGHGHGHEWSIHIPFVPCLSPLPHLRLGYFKHRPWKIQGQAHEWGQRSRSNSCPSIEPMYFFLISCQSDQPFLRYGQLSVSPWKNTFKILKTKNCSIHHFQQACWVPSGLTTPKQNPSSA